MTGTIDGVYASPTSSLETMAHDIGYGIRTLLQLLEADQVRTGRNDAALLGSGERGDLLPLGMAAAYLFARHAGDRIDVHNSAVAGQRQGDQA